MVFKNKKTKVFFILLGFLFFWFSFSQIVLAEGCQWDKRESSFIPFFSPFINFVNQTSEELGVNYVIAAAPDPDFCGSDLVGCSGSTPTASID